MNNLISDFMTGISRAQLVASNILRLLFVGGIVGLASCLALLYIWPDYFIDRAALSIRHVPVLFSVAGLFEICAIGALVVILVRCGKAQEETSRG